MKLELIDREIWATVKGEFEGQGFRATYSSEDGWAAGNGIECDDESFYESDNYDDWEERLRDLLWDKGYETVFEVVQ